MGRDGAGRLERADHDVFPDSAGDHVGDESDADSGGDEAENRRIVIVLECDPRLEASGVTGPQEQLASPGTSCVVASIHGSSAKRARSSCAPSASG